MRKFLLPTIFVAFMLLNAALFAFLTREFSGGTVTTKHTVTEQQLRRR